jgi:pyruvate/2-oxoglutarate dehydrogenase complex dihydrolipoamide dehydrogenase (E3) component
VPNVVLFLQMALLDSTLEALEEGYPAKNGFILQSANPPLKPDSWNVVVVSTAVDTKLLQRVLRSQCPTEVHPVVCVEIFPSDICNERVISPSHPQNWANSDGRDYDLVVLGSSPTGLVSAITAATQGYRVAMTEQGLPGGTRVNFDCTPNKALIRYSHALYEAGRGSDFGVRPASPPQVDFATVMGRVRHMRSISSGGDDVEAVRRTGADVYRGRARFISPHAVEIDGCKLRFRKAIIATGSQPLLPSVEGLQAGCCLTSESVFLLTEPPARLVVVGGNPQACEMAQAFHRLGSEVDLVIDSDGILPGEEDAAQALIRRRFEQDGLRLHLEMQPVRANGHRLLIQGQAKTYELAYDAVLLGTGRKANVDGLNLEAADVSTGTSVVEVDEYLRTTNPDIYAAGDVAFPEKFTRATRAMARVCVANALSGVNWSARKLVIPYCIYTDPEVAQVGLTPSQARQRSIQIDEHRLDLRKVDRALTDGEEDGFAAIYTRQGTGEIIGALLIAADAGGLISEFTLAIANRVPLDALARTVHGYPTQADKYRRLRNAAPGWADDCSESSRRAMRI